LADIRIGIVAPLELVILVFVLPDAAKDIEDTYVPTDAVTSPAPVIVEVAVKLVAVGGITITFSKYSCDVLSNVVVDIE
jgi:hypothetical protein